jgi:hypothetical protein
MDLCVDADDWRRELRQLIELVRLESQTGSKWAQDVDRAASRGLIALDVVVADASSAGSATNSAVKFAESKIRLVAILDQLCATISARLAFSH